VIPFHPVALCGSHTQVNWRHGDRVEPQGSASEIRTPKGFQVVRVRGCVFLEEVTTALDYLSIRSFFTYRVNIIDEPVGVCVIKSVHLDLSPRLDVSIHIF
jgi:hypothetical protein